MSRRDRNRVAFLIDGRVVWGGDGFTLPASAPRVRHLNRANVIDRTRADVVAARLDGYAREQDLQQLTFEEGN